MTLPPFKAIDWDITERLEALFREVESANAPLRLEGSDGRGSYERASATALRDAASRRGEEPRRVRLFINGIEDDGVTARYLEVVLGVELSSARLIAGNEQVVHHLRRRIEELIARSNKTDSTEAPVSAPPRLSRWHWRAWVDPKNILNNIIAAVIIIVVGWLYASNGLPGQHGTSEKLVQETVWSPIGVKTFSDYRQALGLGEPLREGQTVNVSCRVSQAFIGSAQGGWYRIASPPWNDHYWAPANTFLNGDPVNGPFNRLYDSQVPAC